MKKHNQTTQESQEVIIITQNPYSIESSDIKEQDNTDKSTQGYVFVFKIAMNKELQNFKDAESKIDSRDSNFLNPRSLKDDFDTPPMDARVCTTLFSTKLMIYLLKKIVNDFLSDFKGYEDSIKSDKCVDSTYKNQAIAPSIKYKMDSSRFYIFMHSTQSQILKFSSALSSDLPLSMHFTFLSLEILQDSSVLSDFKDVEYVETNLIPSIKELENIKQNYDLISKFITFSNVNDFSLNIRLLIKNLATKLLRDSHIIIKRDNSMFVLSTITNLKANPNPNYKTQVIFSDLYNATSYLRLSQTQKNALGSFEKPFVLLQVKSAFKKLFSNAQVFAALPFDAVFMLLFDTLQNDFSEESVEFDGENFGEKFNEDSNKKIIGEKFHGDFLFIRQIFTDEINLLNLTPDISYTQNYEKLSANILKKTTKSPHEISQDSHNLRILVGSESSRYVSYRYINARGSDGGDGIFELLRLNKSMDSKRFVVYLSAHHDSAFWIENLNGEGEFSEILNISFATELGSHLQKLYDYENGDKLLKNFAKAHKNIAENWGVDASFLSKIVTKDSENTESKSQDSQNKQDFKNQQPKTQLYFQKDYKNTESKNLLDILALIKKLLNLQRDVLDYAMECVRDRGPRIDYKLRREKVFDQKNFKQGFFEGVLKDENLKSQEYKDIEYKDIESKGADSIKSDFKSEDFITLDYPRILRSVLSFYLADVEIQLIAYGIVESLAEFIGTLSGDMALNYGIKEVFVCGDFLLNQIFLDKIIYAMPKNINLILPNEYGVDYIYR